jgi:hypothetical protein
VILSKGIYHACKRRIREQGYEIKDSDQARKLIGVMGEDSLLYEIFKYCKWASRLKYDRKFFKCIDKV